MAAAQGNAVVQFNLGIMHNEGWGVQLAGRAVDGARLLRTARWLALKLSQAAWRAIIRRCRSVDGGLRLLPFDVLQEKIGRRKPAGLIDRLLIAKLRPPGRRTGILH